MDVEQFKKVIQSNRKIIIPRPNEIVDLVLKESPYYEKDSDFFIEHANEILYYLRKGSWEKYLLLEKVLDRVLMGALIQEDPSIMKYFSQRKDEAVITFEVVKDIVASFLEHHGGYLFELSKSHTNSRRSRAGKEFEFIIETILLRCGIMFDNQGVIGSKLFNTERLGKLVDFVIPGVVEYDIERRKCALVSMKTSLRERWQEVPEEMKRTGAQEMFLLTLDSGISSNTIESLASHNITLVVPDDLKIGKYGKNRSVYGLTKFLFELKELNRHWLSQEEDLGQDFYKKKVQSINKRLMKVTGGYEKNILVSLRDYFVGRIQ
ncbi:type II restriction endonuclease [Bacillus sp. CFBP9009]